jgi:hypothetical protein
VNRDGDTTHGMNRPDLPDRPHPCVVPGPVQASLGYRLVAATASTPWSTFG